MKDRGSSFINHRRENIEMASSQPPKSSNETRTLGAVFVEEEGEGLNPANMLYVRLESGEYKTLEQMKLLSEESAEESEGLTASLIETTSPNPGTTTSVSVSVAGKCCVVIRGVEICWRC